MASLLAIEKAIEAYNERRGLRQAIIAAIDAAARVDGAHVDAGKASSAVDGDAQWNAAIEAAAQKLEGLYPKVHAHASENSDRYRAQDETCRHGAMRIRSLKRG